MTVLDTYMYVYGPAIRYFMASAVKCYVWFENANKLYSVCLAYLFEPTSHCSSCLDYVNNKCYILCLLR